jgi:hypothetical protein
MITCTILDNGDLQISLDDSDAKAELQEIHERRGYWAAMCEAFESYSCNGSFTPFDAGDGNPFVGLTSAPCIAESMDCADNGDLSIDGRFWYFADYMIRNDMAELIESGSVVYKLATEADS